MISSAHSSFDLHLAQFFGPFYSASFSLSWVLCLRLASFCLHRQTEGSHCLRRVLVLTQTVFGWSISPSAVPPTTCGVLLFSCRRSNHNAYMLSTVYTLEYMFFFYGFMWDVLVSLHIGACIVSITVYVASCCSLQLEALNMWLYMYAYNLYIYIYI